MSQWYLLSLWKTFLPLPSFPFHMNTALLHIFLSFESLFSQFKWLKLLFWSTVTSVCGVRQYRTMTGFSKDGSWEWSCKWNKLGELLPRELLRKLSETSLVGIAGDPITYQGHITHSASSEPLNSPRHRRAIVLSSTALDVLSWIV